MPDYDMAERVAIKMDSGIPENEAVQQAKKEMFAKKIHSATMNPLSARIASEKPSPVGLLSTSTTRDSLFGGQRNE